MTEIYACEVKVDKLPPETKARWLGRLSLDTVFRLVRCSVLRARTTPEQRQALSDAGDMVELTKSVWLSKAESTQYKTPEG